MKIYSHNLSGNNGDVERRLNDFADRVQIAQPDILFMQEVSCDIGYTALKNLTHQMGPDYTMKFETTYPDRENEQGVAVMSKYPILESSVTDYSDGGHQSQIVTLRGRYGQVIGANVHHEALPSMEPARRRKNIELASNLNERGVGTSQIIAGVLNALPKFPSVRILEKTERFQSAYKQAHKKHAPTYPTMSVAHMLEGAFMQVQDLEALQRLTRLTNFFQTEKYEMPAFTLDYIFLKNAGRVASAHLIRSWRDVSKSHRDQLEAMRKSSHAYAISDHFGLEVKVAL